MQVSFLMMVAVSVSFCAVGRAAAAVAADAAVGSAFDASWAAEGVSALFRDVVGAMWMEFSFAAFFLLGFCLLRLDLLQTYWSRWRRASAQDDPQFITWNALLKQISVEYSMGNSSAVVEVWQSIQAMATIPQAAVAAARDARAVHAVPLETVRIVVMSLQAEGKTKLLGSMAGFLLQTLELLHPVAASAKQTAAATTLLNAVLEALARVSGISEVEAALESCVALGFCRSVETTETLVGLYAASNREADVRKMIDEAVAAQRVTPRCYSVAIKGFLKQQNVTAAKVYLLEMKALGYYVPCFAVTELAKVAIAKSRADAAASDVASIGSASLSLSTDPVDMVVSTLERDGLTVPSECLSLLFEHAMSVADATPTGLDLVERLEHLSVRASVPMLYCSYDSLVKAYVKAGRQDKAVSVFEEMRSSGFRVSEGTCVGLMSLCAETQNVKFAHHVRDFARNAGLMASIPMYSALMKVYAFSSMHDRATDLYQNVLDDGLEPDAQMYGCLIKFSVDCGRVALARELFQKCPSSDMPTHMALIRACQHDSSVETVFSMLEDLRVKLGRVDIGAYNCALDVLVSMGEGARSEELIKLMREAGQGPDMVTYNTLLKYQCASGDSQGAQQTMDAMKKDGVAPNEVSYNTRLNAAASQGALEEAWRLVAEMRSHGVNVDCFACATMLKAANRGPKQGAAQEMRRALSLVESCCNAELAHDEVLVCSYAESCARFGEKQRLADLLRRLSPLSPRLKRSVHLYASLIKANGALGREQQCRKMWDAMTLEQQLVPSQVALGTYLDALVVCGNLQGALAVFRQHTADEGETSSNKLEANAVMYSTLLKGAAQQRQSHLAEDLWAEMRNRGIVPSVVTLNGYVDALVRCPGNMPRVEQLVADAEAGKIEGVKAPDTVTYATVVKGYCSDSMLHKALNVFGKMRSSGSDTQGALDAVVYNSLLDGCVRECRQDVAEEILRQMERDGVKPTAVTMTVVVKLYGRLRQVDRAFSALEEMQQKHGLVANSFTRTCLMSACVGSNQLDRALRVFDDMKKDGLCPDGKTFGTLIQGCTQRNQLEKAVALLEEAFGLHGHLGKADGSRSCVRSGACTPGGQHLAQVTGVDGDVIDRLLSRIQNVGRTEELAGPLLERVRSARPNLQPGVYSQLLRGAVGTSAAPGNRMTKTTNAPLRLAPRTEAAGGIDGSWRQ